MEGSNFVLAGVESFSSIIDTFFDSPEFKNNFTREDISNFLGNTCNKYLHSFGGSFQGRKNYDKYIKKEIRLYNRCKATNFFTKSQFYLDSGGYQISAGYLDENEVEGLIGLYHSFILNQNLYDKAFTLDITPGPNCKVLKNFKQVLDINLRTYNIAREFPDEIRRKMIYVHHFRTPKMWEVFSEILNQKDMFNSFSNFATGGIVANMASDMSIPCIIYVLPIVSLLIKCLENNVSTLNFHVLGGANFRDIMFYELFKIHVLKTHKITLNITYDSSAIFKALLIGRYTSIGRDDGRTLKLNLKSNNLNKRCEDKTIIEHIRISIIEMCQKMKIKEHIVKDLYNPKTNTFYHEDTIYLILLVFYTYTKLQSILSEKATNLYPLYESGDISEFSKEMHELTQKINYGKITKKQKAKANSVAKSLDILTSLDQDYCKYIVNKFLAKDEFIHLL